MGSVLLIFSVLCVVSFLGFVYFRLVSCVPNVELFILDCVFGFLLKFIK